MTTKYDVYTPINTTKNHYKAWPYSSSLYSSTITGLEFLYNSGDEPNSPSYSNYLKPPLSLKLLYVYFMNFSLHPYIIGLSNINASHLVQTYKHANSTTLIQNFSLLAGHKPCSWLDFASYGHNLGQLFSRLGFMLCKLYYHIVCLLVGPLDWLIQVLKVPNFTILGSIVDNLQFN